ncbi:MAG: hypothetical protein QM767_23575 [Anaeromyxobacter sp.]
MPLAPHEQAELAAARRALDEPGLAIRLADLAGRPIDGLVKRLPEAARGKIDQATRKALSGALDLALRTLDGGAPRAPRDWLHRGLVVASGVAGRSRAARAAGRAALLPHGHAPLHRRSRPGAGGGPRRWPPGWSA